MRHRGRVLVWAGVLALVLLVSGPSVAAEPRIVFSSNRDGNDELYTVNPDGSGLVRVTDDPAQDAAPVWSPDGAKIAFASNRDGDFEIYVADFDGANLQQLTDNEVVDFAPAFSPDGSQIAFSTDRVGNRDIFVMNADGSDPQPVTEGTGFEEEPAWSPDGTTIAFWRSVDVFTVDPDGSNLTNLTAEFEPVSVRPAWSPDGSRIAFETTTDGIWTMSPEGSDHQQVTSDGAAPDWSPDGAQLVYWGSNPPPSGPSDLLIVSADGGEPVPVTDDEFVERDPDWHIAETGGGGEEPDTSIVDAPDDYELGSSARFEFDSDQESVAFECELDGADFTSCDSPQLYEGLADGPHRFRVRAVTEGGTADESPATHRWTVDTVPSEGDLDRHNGAVLGVDSGFEIGGETGREIAQIFSPDVSGQLLEVRVGVTCPSESAVTVRIERTDGGQPTGIGLAEATTTPDTATPFERFVFDGPPDLIEGTRYALVVAGPESAGCFAYPAQNAPPALFMRDTAPEPGSWDEWPFADRMAFATFMLVDDGGGGEDPSFVVTNTNDGGAGSLRQAIVDANTTPGHDTITFAIDGGGVHTIAPTTPLPQLSETVTIDGYSQPGAQPSSVALGAEPDAVLLIELAGDSLAEAVPALELNASNSTIRGLVINGPFSNGIQIGGESVGNAIRGNYIGTDPSGMESDGLQGWGVEILDLAEDNVVGGTTSADHNVISGNGIEGGGGVRIGGSARANQVLGNLIGLSANGRLELPNVHGVTIANSATENVVGGPSVTSNFIAGNAGDGVRILTGGNSVEGNFIGFTWIQPEPLPVIHVGNGGHGLRVSASDTVVFNNMVANNDGAGVAVVGSETAGVEIRRTRARLNGGLGIDLGVDGVTANDGPGDADTGPNGLQNHPTLEDVTLGETSTTIDGRLESASSTAYELDFFQSTVTASNPDGCDPTGFGEGQGWIGTATFSTDATGSAEFSATLPVAVPPGAFITATATAPDGSTSEYSECFEVEAAGEPSFVVTNTDDSGEGSLRQAMLDANANEDANTITFAIPGDGVHTISFASPLPAVVRPVTIDGTSQPREGEGTNPLIVLDGSDAGEGADGFRLGGTDSTVKGLLISGFPGSGIAVTGERTTIEGNWIGTDQFGLKRVPNGAGISIFDAEETMIRANVVSGNAGNGIEVLNDGSPDFNFAFQNRIGVGADGETPLGNGGHGIYLSNSDFMLVGDNGTLPTTPPVFPVPDGGNTIAYNAGAGVFVEGTFGNRIVANSIHSNGGLGIDLAPAGITPNDVEDGDEGPNELQNFPELESVELTPETTDRIDVRASVAAVVGGETYRIDYYANFACDPSGNGEGERHLGHTVATSGGGTVEFVSTSIGPVASGELITATVTDPMGNTSEHSACHEIGEDLGELAFTDPSECVPGFLGGHTIDFEDAPEDGAVTMYGELGITFVATGQAVPRAVRAPEFPTSSPTTRLVNVPVVIEGGSGSSSEIPLRMTFTEPQTAVGFFLGNGGDVLATVTALDGGDTVGSVQIAVPTDAVTTYIGIKLLEGTFDALTVDYGGAVGPEELDDLCFLTSEAEGEESDAITLTSDHKTVPAGVEDVPLSSVPSNQLPSFAGSPTSAPVGSIPVGSIPVGSIPVGSIPVGSIPVGSIPVGSIPVGSIPVGSIPVGSIGLAAVPVGSIGLDQILLSQLPVDADALLDGTPLVDRPRQSITLADVYANATTRERFNALNLPESGLMQSILSGVPFSAFLLGRATLSQLPAPGGASTWCAAITAAGGSCTGVSGSNTVVGLSIAGVPVGSIPVGSIPVGSIPVGSIPVGSIPVGSIDLVASRLAGIPVGSIPEGTRGDVVELPFDGTLGEAKAAGRIKQGALLRHLVGAFPANLVLNDLIMGIVPRSALAWESFPIDGFQLFAGTGDVVRYRLAFTLACPVATNFAARVRLPEGWLYKPGTTRWRYGTGTPAAGAEPSTTSRAGARWTQLPDTPCPAGVSSRPVELSFDALSGLELGIEEATASVTMGGTTHSTGDEAPVLVTQNWEANDDLAGAQTIGANRLVVGHVAKAGDVEIFRLPIPDERGTRTTVYLSHIAEGADFDLTIYKPAAPSLQSSPVGSIPVGSIPVEDGGSSVDNRTDALPPDTLQDIPVGSIPVGSIPVGSISANRGTADEAALVVADGEEGFYTIAVSGYNGSHSDRPFVLRVVQTPPPDLPPCPARGLTFGSPGTLPAPAAGIKTLFVVNRQRMAALHGEQQTADMIAAAASVAVRPEVAGQILEVDGDAAVRAAYAAWDASPCSIDAVNGVVAAVNAVVARYRAASPNVENVVLLGSDDALPMMRRLDPVTISNETDEAPDLLFTLRNGNANSLYAAAALGYFLSDMVYGAFTSVPWLGRDLYLPNVAVGRLVETATEIERQLLLYVSKDGLLDPNSTFTSAYDFLTDGGQAVAAGLAGVGASNEALINDTWTASTLTPKLSTPADVLSVNAHYSHWLLQPASGATLVSTGDLPDVEAAFSERILFTMGCHGGLNVPDTLLGASPSAFQQERLLDWTQAYARANAAVYVANTGFGYGDTVANALSERLMSIFAGELSDGGTVGERWLDSVHDYFGTAGVYGVYDEKALTEATFYGLPFWSLGAETPDSPPAAGTLPTDPASGLPVASINRSIAAEEHSTPRGRFWDAQGDTLAIHYRPLQPRVAIDVTRAGLVATGVIVKSLQTQDVGGVDPVHHTPTIDLAANEPERRFRELIFPANAVSLTRSRSVPGGERQHAVVIAGQYRPGDSPNNGTERLITQIGLEVAYVPAVTDETSPVIQEVSVVNTSSATIFVRAAESAVGGVRRVAALYAPAGSAGTWSFVELSFNAARGGWEATVPTAGDVQVIAMAQNANGLVAYSANKGQNHPSVTDTTGPEILLESPGPDSTFLLNQQVRPSFSCSDAGVVVSCTGSPLVNGLLDTSQPGERTFTITARDLSGRESTLEVTYFVRYVFEGFFPPVENAPILNTGQAGRTYPVKWRLKDANGVLVKTLSAVRSIARVPLASCADRQQETVEPGDELSSSSLKFDGEQYVYNWKTERADAGCRRLVVELADGTRRNADFLLR